MHIILCQRGVVILSCRVLSDAYQSESRACYEKSDLHRVFFRGVRFCRIKFSSIFFIFFVTLVFAYFLKFILCGLVSECDVYSIYISVIERRITIHVGSGLFFVYVQTVTVFSNGRIYIENVGCIHIFIVQRAYNKMFRLGLIQIHVHINRLI